MRLCLPYFYNFQQLPILLTATITITVLFVKLNGQIRKLQLGWVESSGAGSFFKMEGKVY